MHTHMKIHNHSPHTAVSSHAHTAGGGGGGCGGAAGRTGLVGACLAGFGETVELLLGLGADLSLGVLLLLLSVVVVA